MDCKEWVRYPFCVDTWSASSSSFCRRRHHFLSHAHLDHTRGIASHDSSYFPIYCTSLTARLVLLRYPKLLSSAFVPIPIEEPRLIEDEDGSFTVTAYDANHCPGAVMFLFEGDFGVVLHTGDCRLAPECFSRLPRRLYSGGLDCLFLDCTFGREAVKMPHKTDAIKQVKQCVWNHPEAPTVYLACDLLGQEMLLRSLSGTFGLKIFVDKHELPDFYASLAVVEPELVTDDPKSTRLHVCEGFPKLYERARQKFAEAHSKGQPEPIFIRPSAQWYTYGERLEGVGSGLLILEKIYQKAPSITRRRAKSAPTDAERDPFGIWHICYSMHSSREELELFLSKFKPKHVISTTPHCKATELSYVKNLKFSERSQVRSIVELRTSVAAEHKGAPAETLGGPKTASEPTLLPATSPIRHIPLFGRAVAGGLPASPPLSFDAEDDDISDNEQLPSPKLAHDPIVLELPVHEHPDSEVSILRSSDAKDVSHKDLQRSPLRDAENTIYHEKVDVTSEARDLSYCQTSGVEGRLSGKCRSHIQEASRGFGETTRRIYRSLNMVIPRPLPSLLELDREIKRSRY